MKSPPEKWLVRFPGDLAAWVREHSKSREQSITATIIEAVANERTRSENGDGGLLDAVERLLSAINANPDERWEALVDVLHYLAPGAAPREQPTADSRNGAAQFADVIYRARTERRWTQAELAKRIGGSADQTVVSRLERGLISDPGSRLVARIAKALDLNASNLLGLLDK